MEQAHRMGRGQAVGNLPADAQHVHQLQRTGRIQLLLQGSTGDALHDQIGDRLALDGVDGDDVRVANGRGRPRSRDESLAGAEVAARSGDMSLMATNRCNFSSSAFTTVPKRPLPSTSRTS